MNWKDFYLGFLSCLALGSMIGMTQIHNRYGNEREIFTEFQNLYQSVQPKIFKVFQTTPTYKDFNEGEVVRVSTGSQFLLFRESTTLYWAQFTTR